MPKGGKKKGKISTKVEKVKRNPLFEKKPKNFRIGGDIRPKTDLTRFVRWPRYVLLQRQKKILMKRLKVPPTIYQFTKTIDRNQATTLFKLMQKYKPESKKDKRNRLLDQAQSKAKDQQTKTGSKPICLKFGLNHVTTLIENKQAKLVAIANDTDPIELVLCLPQLCRKQEVPFCFVKNKERLGSLVHQKSATVVALTEVRKEDASELDLLSKAFRTQYNENKDLVRNWGGGERGIKSQHRVDLMERQKEQELAKKLNLGAKGK